MRVRAIAAATVAVVAAACGSASREAAPPTVATPSPHVTTKAPTRVLATTTSTSAPCGRTSTASYRHVVWIWMENRSYSQVLGSTGAATHLKSYARGCAVATAYYAITHPSLPNYLAGVSGSTGGVTSDCGPQSCPQRRASLFWQITRHGYQWRSYAESMSRNCDQASYGRYAARHNPAVYFPWVHTACTHWDVPMGGSTGAFATALHNNTLHAFTFVTPNLCHDGHDCSTTTADDWLGTWLGRIVASPAYAGGHTVVFVTWDEGLDGSNNRVATVVIGPSVTPGTVSATRFTHYSLLRTAEELLGLSLLGNAKTAHSMRPLL